MKTRLWRRARRCLIAYRAPESVAEILARQRQELMRAMTLVRAFYACAAFIMVHETQSWDQWRSVKALHPLWPLFWIEQTGVAAAIPIVLGTALTSTLAAMLVPELRIARIAAAVGLLVQSALLNSLAGEVVSHGLHAWIWIATMFILLPSGRASDIIGSRARSQRYLRVFWAAQTMILLFYSMGGGVKVLGAIWQGANGLVHAFAPQALARHTAYRLLEGADLPAYFAAGPWLVSHPSFGILIYPLSIYLETLAFFIAFRPALHRVWATGLIGMHLGIFFFMTILFSPQILMLGLMFIASPFSPTRFSLREAMLQLPLCGDIAARIRHRQRCARAASKSPLAATA